MTKETLTAFIDTYGRRIVALKWNDNRVIFLNYANSPQIEDCRMETIGDDDFFIVPKLDLMSKNDYESLYLIDEFQAIVIAANDDDYILPSLLK